MKHCTEAVVVLRFATDEPLSYDQVRAFLSGWKEIGGKPAAKPCEFILSDFGPAKPEAEWTRFWLQAKLNQDWPA